MKVWVYCCFTRVCLSVCPSVRPSDNSLLLEVCLIYRKKINEVVEFHLTFFALHPRVHDLIDFVLFCFEFFVPFENFSLIWRRHHCRWRAANFLPMLGTNGHWGFLNMPHLLWHGTSVYNGHLRGPMTHTLWRGSCHYLF